MVQLEMRDHNDGKIFYAIEVIFSVLFALEVVFKMIVEWFWPYWSSLFNVFDLCIVLVTLVSLVWTVERYYAVRADDCSRARFQLHRNACSAELAATLLQGPLDMSVIATLRLLRGKYFALALPSCFCLTSFLEGMGTFWRRRRCRAPISREVIRDLSGNPTLRCAQRFGAEAAQ